jgi:signal transduction histidine kinase
MGQQLREDQTPARTRQHRIRRLLPARRSCGRGRWVQARPLEIQIVYAADKLRLRIRDDGIGVDSRTLGAGSAADHQSVLGMRERAKRVGAELEISCRPGAGTEIELSLSASTAYATSDNSSEQWRR